MSFDPRLWNHPEYSLCEAAFLVCEMEPTARDDIIESPDGDVSGDKNVPLLVVKIAQRLLDEVPRQLREFDWIFLRQDLMAWCERNGFRPAFLFPGANSPAPDKPLSNRERNDLLRTLGALALLVIEQQQGRKYWRGEKINRAELVREIIRVLEAVGFSAAGQASTTLSPKLKEALEEALRE